MLHTWFQVHMPFGSPYMSVAAILVMLPTNTEQTSVPQTLGCSKCYFALGGFGKMFKVMVIYIYIAPGQGQTTILGQKF